MALPIVNSRSLRNCVERRRCNSLLQPSVHAPKSANLRRPWCSRKSPVEAVARTFNHFSHSNVAAQAAATLVEKTLEVDIAATSARALLTPGPLRNPPTVVTAPGRIVAIGDLHGDLRKAYRALRLARVLDFSYVGQPYWCGGDTTVVQVGDVLDRGDDEIAIVQLLRVLDAQAREEGGAVYMLNGNHESLNVCGDFRYVTPGAFEESGRYAGLTDQELKGWEEKLQARAFMYLPGGPMALELSLNPTVLVVNDTVFAHGGLLPIHVNYGLDRMNREVAAWMRKDFVLDEDDEEQAGSFATPPFLAMGDANSVMWNRQMSRERFTSPIDRYHACNALTQALNRVGAKRLVVGHTPQMRGCNCECDGKVWRIDVGMSQGVLNAPVSVLEIKKDEEGEMRPRVMVEATADNLGTLDEDSAVDF